MTITLEIFRGVLTDVSGLPEGWLYELFDHDVDDEEPGEPEDKVVQIVIQGGCVYDVFNLPEGYTYTVNDLDDREEEYMLSGYEEGEGSEK